MGSYTDNDFIINNLDENNISFITGFNISDEAMQHFTNAFNDGKLDTSSGEYFLAAQILRQQNEDYYRLITSEVGPELLTWPFPNTDAIDLLKIDNETQSFSLNQKVTRAELARQLDPLKKRLEDINKDLKLDKNTISQFKELRKLLNNPDVLSFQVDGSEGQYDTKLAFNNKLIQYIERPEDHDGDIALDIYYNGTSHKTIEGVTLTGHMHMIGQGGECIKEIYTFIAKRVTAYDNR
jgi:hypothetical protein